jgi:hypothetical protein
VTDFIFPEPEVPMRRASFLGLVLTLAMAACTGADPVSPDSGLDIAAPVAEDATQANACWGQASKVFAQTGEMGAHSSQQANPRLGLRNLARALYAQGVLADDTMAELGWFVSAALGLSIDACLT